MTVFIKDILNQGNLIKWIIVFNSFKFIGGNKLTTASFATFFSVLIAEKSIYILLQKTLITKKIYQIITPPNHKHQESVLTLCPERYTVHFCHKGSVDIL